MNNTESVDDDGLDWISYIHWQALFYFYPESFKTGLFKRVEKNMLKSPEQRSVEDFTDIIESHTLDNAKKKIAYGHKSNNKEEDYKSWSYGKKSHKLFYSSKEYTFKR